MDSQETSGNGHVPPDPATYDALVSSYLHADTAKERQRVVKRLESDADSAHAVVRYYAVEAMAKLGRKVFGAALENATQDENEAVRNVAVKALKG